MPKEELIIEFIKKAEFTPKSLLALKKLICQSQINFPRNSQIFASYQKLLKDKKIRKNNDLENFLKLKKIRSLSGVCPVAVLTKSYPCPGKCIYCPTQINMPKSYLDDEPAVLRAINFNFDAWQQVKARLGQYQATGHTPEKIELIIMGGTFSHLPKKYQERFVKDCFDACNQTISKTLLQAQKTNEKAKHRIIGLTLETRPDCINPEEIKNFRKLGCTRVELGVQSVYDDVLKLVNRGHDLSATVKATKLLKDSGFKICYHLMPNLPGSCLKSDLEMFKIIFEDERFKPDMIKIYPCVVCYQAELYQWFLAGKYQPYTDQELISLLIKIKKIVPEWVRINRLGRDIPIKNIAAGFKISNIRQVLNQTGAKCSCIRCREIRSQKINKLKLKISKYFASSGWEYFLQYVDKNNNIYALLRLRLAKKAIVRELHAFGQALGLNESKRAVQHLGLGKKLIAKAENIAKKSGFRKVSVIAGVGVRDYYKKLGYELKKTYMVKYLDIRKQLSP